MVFVVDDIAEDVTIGGVLASLAAYFFPAAETTAAEATASETISGVSSIIEKTAQETPGGVEYLKDLFGNAGESIANMSRNIPDEIELIENEYNENVPMAESIYDEVMSGKIVKNKQPYINGISNIIGEVSKKIPKNTAEFKNLITDVARYVINNPKKTILTGASVAGSVAGGITLLNKIKNDYTKAKNIPYDIKKDVNDISKTINDIIP